MGLDWGKEFQAEGTANAKVLGYNCAWQILRGPGARERRKVATAKAWLHATCGPPRKCLVFLREKFASLPCTSDYRPHREESPHEKEGKKNDKGNQLNNMCSVHTGSTCVCVCVAIESTPNCGQRRPSVYGLIL
uniref:Uncharacterized protein n=1 Tax=Pipistrellus kuhlii TaxID=59472 RepID=A0A7J7QU60_PIPKU|nr:hypothetical protein mPipKuh1_008456 [Pipistrellus kuhlii]